MWTNSLTLLVCTIVLVCLAASSSAQVEQAPDSEYLAVSDFQSDAAVFGPVECKLFGQLLTRELDQFMQAMPPLDDRDSKLYILGTYLKDAKGEEASSQFDTFPIPDLICQGVVTKGFISASISRFGEEKRVADGAVSISGYPRERDFRKLAETLIEKWLYQEYGTELNRLSLHGIRLPRTGEWQLAAPRTTQQRGHHWLGLYPRDRSLIVYPQVGELTYPAAAYNGVRRQSFQLWRVVQQPEQRPVVRPLRHRLELSGQLAWGGEATGYVVQGGYMFNLDGKSSLGIGIDMFQLALTAQVQSEQGWVFTSFNYRHTLVCPALQFQYQHYISSLQAILGFKLLGYPIQQGGAVKAYLGIPKLHWLRLEVGYASLLAALPDYQFEATTLQAEEGFENVRLPFFTTGITLTTSF